MTDRDSHARAVDLPGWPCPPRVRDIPTTQNSWGWVPVQAYEGAVAQDELGFLWVDGNVAPKYRLPRDSEESPGALVCWTETGLGLWVHPKSLASLRDISRLDDPDRWVPVATVLSNLPDFVTTPEVPA